MRQQRSILPWIVFVAVVVMVARMASTFHVFNDVIDEPYHIGSGIAMYQAKRHVYGVQHPPLPRLVGALPLALSGVGAGETRAQLGTRVDDLEAFNVGHRALLDSHLSYWSVLTRARAAMLIFPIIAVVYLYLLGTYLINRMTGGVAAMLLSTDPTLLAHGGLVTTDAAAAAGFLAATYHGIRFIARPNWLRMLASGMTVGLAIACKFTCLLVIPALGLIWLLRGRRALGMTLRVIPLSLFLLIVALLILWAAYAFDIGKVNDFQTAQALETLPHELRDIPLPAPTAFMGAAIFASHAQAGHAAYLNGEVRNDGWWYYFPVALAIKSPGALLIGIFIAILILSTSRRRAWQRTLMVLIPAAVFLGASMFSSINIGVRHVLPVIPFLYLFVAMWLVRARLARFSFALVGLAMLETALVHPDYIGFFNATAGGPSNGHKLLLDSNLDWGQDQWQLKRWLENNANGRTVSLSLFGNPRLRQWPSDNYILAPEGQLLPGLLAISKNRLYGLDPKILRDSRGRIINVETYRRMEPLARIGSSIHVYEQNSHAPTGQDFSSGRSPARVRTTSRKSGKESSISIAAMTM